MPRPLYPLGKNTQYPMDRKLDGPQSRSGRHGELKILTLVGLELRLLGLPTRNQSLYRLTLSLLLRKYILIKVDNIKFHENLLDRRRSILMGASQDCERV
jgi:hypothetical protein